MAPLEQRKPLRSVYENPNDAIVVLAIEKKSYVKGRLDLGIRDYPDTASSSGWVSSSTPTLSPTTTTTSALGQSTVMSTGAQTSINPDAGSHSLSITAQHVLISAATIGALIFIGTVIYCLLRFLKVDVTRRFRRFTRRRRSSWRPGSYSGTENYAPPYVNLDDEKFGPSTKTPYEPIAISPVPIAVLPYAQAPTRADLVHQNMVREALLLKLSNTALYHETLLSPTIPQPTHPPSVSYGPSRPLSDLSSLSSGFGDAKIDIPESNPTRPRSQHKSRASRGSRNTNTHPRFSWSSSPTTLGRTKGNRDTIYTSNTTKSIKSIKSTITTSSEDSAPRFRSVNSWVNHQANRLQKQRDHDKEVDSMPAIPVPAPVKKANHWSVQSEVMDPIFKYHPGDEVPLPMGSRVPSAILDKLI